MLYNLKINTSSDALGLLAHAGLPCYKPPAMPKLKGNSAALLACAISLALPGCSNSPYPASDERANTLYTTFDQEPKHLDTATAYSSDCYALLCNIVEPPFQYHFLKRPYELEPLLASEVPRPETRRIEWQGETINAIVYTVPIKQGVLYQDHPCFVKKNLALSESDAEGIDSVWDFTEVDTRELIAEDFVLAIRRLCDPRVTCPIISTLEQNILGLEEYGLALGSALDAERERRTEAGGAFYNRQQDEKYNPVRLDYWAHPLPGARATGRYTFEIVLKHPYPQILYWMAMPFFAPVPHEAVDFFHQSELLKRNIVFDKNTVGTGPYVLAEFDPTNQFVLERNANFRDEKYPDLPEPDPRDPEAMAHYEALRSAGGLEDAGRQLPMVDRVIFRREIEWIPRWAKFRQGYYDTSGIASDVFDQSITLTSTGDAVLSEEMDRQGITLYTAPSASIGYFCFNMRDPVVGGYEEKQRKLRQAISIAFDTEEQITIFSNGRGTVAHSPTPPGFFGYESGEPGINPVSHEWDPERGRAVRRSIDAAKDLMKEAGYEAGYGPDGKPLVLYFDNAWISSSDRPRLRFVTKQFAKLGIQLKSRTTDYNRFQDKVREGSFQILSWGWIADYPDPENFLFLLYGPNSRADEGGGANSSNYAGEEYGRLFERMSNMENGPERLALVRRMNRILQEDAPWFGCVHGMSYSLVHDWYKNGYPNVMAWGQLKYRRIDIDERAGRRREWNSPRWHVPAVFVAILILGTLPAIRVAVRHLKET
jgi:oligopeptide transport system substrate-binding protein